MTDLVYRAAEAALVAKVSRPRVDAACHSGALVAVDLKPESSRRDWRILHDDLVAWIAAGYPTAVAA